MLRSLAAFASFALGGAILLAVCRREDWKEIPKSKRRLLQLRERCLACHPGVSSGETSFLTASGPLVCLRYLRNEADERRPTVLLLHGAYASSVALLPLIDALRTTHRVFALDLPGWGVSDDLRLRGRRLEDRVDAVVEALRWFVDTVVRTDGAPIAVYAHSFGAYYAVELARRHPDAISDLVLACPAGLFSTLGSLGAYWALLFVTSAHHRFLRATRWVSAPLVEALARGSDARFCARLACSDFEGASVLAGHIRFDFGNSRWRRPNLNALSAVRARTSLLFGERDELIPRHQGDALRRLTKGELECRILREAAHCVHRDDRFVSEIVRAILDDQGRKTPAEIESLAEGVSRLHRKGAHALGASFCRHVSLARIIHVYEIMLDARLEAGFC